MTAWLTSDLSSRKGQPQLRSNAPSRSVTGGGSWATPRATEQELRRRNVHSGWPGWAEPASQAWPSA